MLIWVSIPGSFDAHKQFYAIHGYEFLTRLGAGITTSDPEIFLVLLQKPGGEVVAQITQPTEGDFVPMTQEEVDAIYPHFVAKLDEMGMPRPVELHANLTSKKDAKQQYTIPTV